MQRQQRTKRRQTLPKTKQNLFKISKKQTKRTSTGIKIHSKSKLKSSKMKRDKTQIKSKPKKKQTKRLNLKKISPMKKSEQQQIVNKKETKLEEKIIPKIPIAKQENKLNQNDRSQYLDTVFKRLRKQRSHQIDKNIPVGTIYEGFKTIPIQKLNRKYHLLKNRIDKKRLDGSKIWFRNKDNKVLHYEENSHLTSRQQNGFFETLYQAYLNHGDLKLTPDDVWLTIMFYFSKYVDTNSKQLRSAFVNHQGKMDLVIETKSISQKDWLEFFEKIIQVIRQKTCPGVTQNLQCNFSSTTQFSLIMSTALIMNTFKKYFTYIREGGLCGIVNIHMGGTLEDWQNLQKKLLFLRQFDVDGILKEYVDRLLPVLQQFTQTYKGYAHLQFWNNIYNERPDSFDEDEYIPSQNINGWLIRFFTIADEIQTSQDAKMSEIKVPVKFKKKFTGKKMMIDIVGGCKGVSIEDKYVYRPHFSYALVENSRETYNMKFPIKKIK